jgi:GNAT superfamily N-acetyltransferase
MNITEAARIATVDDTPPILTLARAAIAELSAQRGGVVWRRHDARVEPIEGPIIDAIAASLAGEPTLVVVGTVDDVVVGYGVVHGETVADEGVIGIIEDLYVEPGGRGVGVGAAMMNLILEWATEQGFFGVDSLALPGNRETKNFFESFGLVARAILVHRALPTTGEPAGA